MFNLVKEIKSKTGEVHFKRWSIISSRWFNVYLHYILKADQDKHMHDHPWSFWSIILKGGYVEQSVDKNDKIKTITRRFLHSAYRNKNVPHKILSIIKPTWSLVITGPGGRRWGYKTDETESGWTNHIAYRDIKNKGGWE